MDVGSTTRALALTQQMMPSSAQIARARERLHRTAAFVAVLTVGSYAALVFAPGAFVLRTMGEDPHQSPPRHAASER